MARHRIEFDGIEELSSGMRPARGVHELWATDMIVSAITVALQEAFEVAQEPLGTFPLPAQRRGSGGSAVYL